MDYEYIENLVQKSKDGDNLSKEKLVQEFRPLILNIAKKTFLHGYDKNDIQNECYKSLFKCLSMYNSSNHRFVAYATNGIKNNINDLIRKVKNRSAAEDSEALTLSDNLENNLPSNEDNFEDAICSKCDYEALKLALIYLSTDERELIKFLFFKNNSLASYAALKNLPYSTASRKKDIALMKLSKYFNKASKEISSNK